MKYFYLFITIVMLGFSIMNYVDTGPSDVASLMAFSAFLAFQCFCLCKN